MRITDQQFIQAVRDSVAEKGGDHRADATYYSPFVGGAACIVGYALAKIDQRLCPTSNQHMANVLLPQMGVSRRVAIAAYAAQHLNDSGFKWKYVLSGFEWGLANLRDGVSEAVAITEVRRLADKERGLDLAKVGGISNGGIMPSLHIEGGMIKGGIVKSIKPIHIDYHAISASAQALEAQMTAFSKALLDAQVHFQTNMAVNPVVTEASLAAMGIDPPYTKTAHALAV
jgi:hypothetical protein